MNDITVTGSLPFAFLFLSFVGCASYYNYDGRFMGHVADPDSGFFSDGEIHQGSMDKTADDEARDAVFGYSIEPGWIVVVYDVLAATRNGILDERTIKAIFLIRHRKNQLPSFNQPAFRNMTNEEREKIDGVTRLQGQFKEYPDSGRWDVDLHAATTGRFVIQGAFYLKKIPRYAVSP